jgi:hypothetical protein
MNGFEKCCRKSLALAPEHFSLIDNCALSPSTSRCQECTSDITEEAALWLDDTLALEPERPTILMLHQPPFASSTSYIDIYACKNGPRLAEVVQRHACVERIVCGHIHRSMQLRSGGTLLCTAPSTTTAIALRLQADAQQASFVEPPALLLHHWSNDSGLITHQVPIGDFPGPFPFA